MIEFSCHTWAFNDLTLTEALGTIARLGFRYADLGSGAHLNLVKAAADPRRVTTDILNDLRLYNLKLADVYLLLPHLGNPDPERRQRDIDLFRGLVPFLHAVGTPGVTLSPGVVPPDDPASDTSQPMPPPDGDAPDAEPPPTPYELARDALRELVALADGLPLSIEPHLDSVAPTPDDALRLIHDVPGLSLTVDWAHLICQNVPPERIARLIPHARHVQVRQAARRKLQAAWSRGRLDAAQVIDSLRLADYDGALCIEYLKTSGWHGAEPVNTVRESCLLRDALRAARDAL